MHQRRRETQTAENSIGKMFSAGIVSVLLAMTLVTANGWTPACVGYTPDDPMYWVLFCWYDPPPGDPIVG